MISIETIRVRYRGDGSTKAFTFPFKVDSASDVHVYTFKDDAMTETHNFTIVPMSGEYPTQGGTITYPADSSTAAGTDTLIIITRNLPVVQLYKFARENALSLEDIENALDTLCMEIQQVNDLAGRGVHVGMENASGFQLPPPDEGKVLGWRENRLDNFDISQFITKDYFNQQVNSIIDLTDTEF